MSTALIGHHLAAGTDPARNGERLLVEAVAPSARTVVDVGANVGEWTTMVLALAPAPVRAVLLEPSPHAVARLRRRFAGDPRVEVEPVARGDAPGPAAFRRARRARARRSCPVRRRGVRPAGAQGRRTGAGRPAGRGRAFGEFGTYANFVAVAAPGAPLVAALHCGTTLARAAARAT